MVAEQEPADIQRENMESIDAEGSVSRLWQP